MNITVDEIACENLETIQIELNRRGASVCDDNGLDPLFTVQIEDSTRECDTRAYMYMRWGLLAGHICCTTYCTCFCHHTWSAVVVD